MSSSTFSQQTILGLDPGRDKCGVAVMTGRQIIYQRIIDSDRAIATIQQLARQYDLNLVVMGNGTTSKNWQKLIESTSIAVPVVTVDEKNSTVEARDRYWTMYPPQGLQRLIPLGLRVPPRPVDDIVAILLIERYFARY